MTLDFETGRKFTILGFLAYAVALFLQYISVLISMRGGYGFYRFMNVICALVLIGIACAFAIKFLANRDMLDFLTGGAIGVAGLIGLFNIYGHSYFGRIVLVVICAAYMLGMAMRARNNSNQMFFMGFCVAFILRVLGEMFIYRLGMVYWLRTTFVYAFLVIVALACAVECRQDNK